MIGCLRTRDRIQPIVALYFEFETVLKFYNLRALFWYTLLCSGIVINLMRVRELFAFLVSCDCKCSIGLPQSAMGWSAVYDCGIFRSYVLTFLSHICLDVRKPVFWVFEWAIPNISLLSYRYCLGNYNFAWK